MVGISGVYGIVVKLKVWLPSEEVMSRLNLVRRCATKESGLGIACFFEIRRDRAVRKRMMWRSHVESVKKSLLHFYGRIRIYTFPRQS